MGVSSSTLSGRPIRMRAQHGDPVDTPTAEGHLKDDFGEYTIRTEKFNDSNDWYCRHHYIRNGGVYGYHYAHLNGRYYSKNPDGSSESVNPTLKEASYTLPGSKIPIDYSDEVDWEILNEIPDPCVVRASMTHEHLREFLEKLKNREEKIVASDQAKKRATWKRMLKGKESPDMVTEDEAEETDYETEKASDEDEEEASQQRLSEQRTGENESETGGDDHRRASHQHKNVESMDEPVDAVETEGTSSEKRKAIELNDSEEEMTRTSTAKRVNMNERQRSTFTEREKRNAANRRKRERRRKAREAKLEMDKRTSES
ncbi:uncharacterized protein N7500_008604 [Penicillium coprophilum]|uniref:uncharacterized protein n=1 Tax=Penicillium coprophilum TaxID=36646 RepID=UPI0023879652|nr:uncharacterized protein N7500_008604 [Penicillium coprophilum]KAJ5158953.1 hypothetical protein N7500_008604 [Penicillium coprophilum]